MAAPVWVLSVDLQTKTAVFTSGMGEAARSARGAFNEIKDGASGAGREVGYSMTEARHSVRFLAEDFGVHIPRALSTFVAGLGPIGPALEAAFPFLALVGLAALFLEHLRKLHEQGENLTEAQMHFGTVTANVLNDLNDKLLQAGIRANELNHNHLGALEKQLKLIDHASMAELVHSFETIAKAADLTLSQLKASWYQFGIGSEGAKHALEQFKSEYEKLLALHKDKEAKGLLSGTLEQAEKVLALQKQARDSQAVTGTHTNKHGDYNKFLEATNELKKYGVGFTEKEVTAQETLVEALRDQVEAEKIIAQLQKLQKDNAEKTEENKEHPEVLKVKRGESILEANRKKEQKLVEEAQLAQLHASDAFHRAMDKQNEDWVRKSEHASDKQRRYEEHIAELRKKTAEKHARDIAQAENMMESEIARGLTSTLMQHQSFASMMSSLGQEVIAGMLQNALMLETVDGRKRLSKARTAASEAFEWGWEHGGIAAPVLAPVLGAGAFAAAMAFEEGGIVPGVGRGDIVPAKLTPGEAVIPKQMTERLSRAADDGPSQRGPVHLHVHHSTTVHAIDAQGMDRVLQKNAAVLNQHLTRELRKLNR
jgi:hypothetical protein